MSDDYPTRRSPRMRTMGPIEAAPTRTTRRDTIPLPPCGNTDPHMPEAVCTLDRGHRAWLCGTTINHTPHRWRP